MGRILAERLRALRLRQDWTRETCASRAGVTAASLKRFENSGKASFELVLKVAHSLSRLEEFEKLFHAPAARSMKELENISRSPQRKRGRI
jgi:transcriptional regulator with XRE-family HTH domain